MDECLSFLLCSITLLLISLKDARLPRALPQLPREKRACLFLCEHILRSVYVETTRSGFMTCRSSLWDLRRMLLPKASRTFRYNQLFLRTSSLLICTIFKQAHSFPGCSSKMKLCTGAPLQAPLKRGKT